MYLQNGTNASTTNCWDDIHRAASAIKSADHVVIGIGSGMTAAGGLCYTDPVLAEKWYPEYFATGKRSIIDIMSDFWPTTINKKNAAAFWGFWARHIWHIRYEAEALQPYLDLYSVVKDKDYFICSTNVDGQLEKAGFSKERIFAPQGDYALFQCQKPCSQDVYSNRAMIETMLDNMASPFEIKEEAIPHCPRCGRLLIPNLRCDFGFVEKPHIQNMEQYEDFLNDSQGKRLALLELGVGFNTPVIIRYPFEQMTKLFPDTTLIRINNNDTDVSSEIADKAICIQDDCGNVLNALRTS
jgi:NAD-dependent SIR2 family protein deacetylase